MTIPLQTGSVYGPVVSRRFGRSLGVNFLPTSRKVCNFDCVYCQYGNPFPSEKWYFPLTAELERDFVEAVSRSGRPDWVMIAGNGEPTLHPAFPEMIAYLLDLRDRWIPGVPVGILSNASTCHIPRVREALSRLDARFMKLDAGNIPDPNVLAGLKRLEKIVLQSLFYEGTARNTSRRDLEEWTDAVKTVEPDSVQVYTIDRPTWKDGLRPVPAERLRVVSRTLARLAGVPSETY